MNVFCEIFLHGRADQAVVREGCSRKRGCWVRGRQVERSLAGGGLSSDVSVDTEIQRVCVRKGVDCIVFKYICQLNVNHQHQ